MRAIILIQLDITPFIKEEDLPGMSDNDVREFFQDSPEILNEFDAVVCKMKVLKASKE